MYKRGVEYHLVNYIAIMFLLMESLLDDQKKSILTDKSCSLKEGLRKKEHAEELFSELKTWYCENLKESIKGEDFGGLGQFLINYSTQLDDLFSLICSCRSRDWLSYLDSVFAGLKYSFARDLQWYARFNTIYHAEMRNLEETDPDIWQAFMNGEFVVQKSPIPFTALFTDQALEQENKILKDHGGVGGVTQDEALLDRVCAVAPVIS